MSIDDIFSEIGLDKDSALASSLRRVLARFEEGLAYRDKAIQEFQTHQENLIKISHIFASKFLEEVGDRPYSQVIEQLKKVFHENNLDWRTYAPVLFISPQKTVVNEDVRADISDRLDNVG